MNAKNISVDHVKDLCARIEQGATPRKNEALSPREFIRQMLPHVKKFLAQGYTYKEIAEFLGYISSGDLKKAVAKEDPALAVKKAPKAEQTEKVAVGWAPCKKPKERKAPQPCA
ncbi:MAG: hypothetical protein LBC79_03225 [Deltaproteobacteria bacterium]|jgi:uncharacterized protein with ATP-grasp and redox domains|nr:hypothetical protein [Deltaproteobacteria bacterium]